jgi:hypothetical protein
MATGARSGPDHFALANPVGRCIGDSVSRTAKTVRRRMKLPGRGDVMKRNQAILLACLLAACGSLPAAAQADAPDPGRVGAAFSGAGHRLGPRELVLVVSHAGDDARAVADPYGRAWKTAYDVWDTNGPAVYGALTVAKPGDWIYFTPSPEPYYVPALPLNLPCQTNSRGVNLYVPMGATLVRTNFGNTNPAPIAASLIRVGPLIIPGNGSRVIVDGTVIATNPADAVLGWATYATESLGVGYRNAVATNAFVEGTGTLRGSSDVIYLSDQEFLVRNRNPVPIVFRNLTLVSDWDCGVFNGGIRVITSQLSVNSSTNMDGNDSHGFVIGCCEFTDRDSVITAMGSTVGPGGNNAALLASASSCAFGAVPIAPRLTLLGTRLIEAGPGTNYTPFYFTNCLVTGWWYESPLAPRRGSSGADRFTAGLVSSNYSLATNVIGSIILPGYVGAGGPFSLNAAGDAFTNSAGNSWVSNHVAGDPNCWWVRTPSIGGTIKYSSTNGPLGHYRPTDQGLPPAPIYGYSNFFSVTLTQRFFGPARRR